MGTEVLQFPLESAVKEETKAAPEEPKPTTPTLTPAGVPKSAEGVELTTEQKARVAGWRPKDEFEGDPMTWVPADEFIARAPLYQKQGKLKREIKELRKTIAQTGEFLNRAQEAAYRKAMADLAKEKKEQIELGNVQEVNRIDEQMRQTAAAVTPVPPMASDADRAVTVWREDKSWFGKDMEMTQYAVNVYTALGADDAPDIDLALEEVDRRVREKYGDRLGVTGKKTPAPVEEEEPTPRRSATVEGGTSTPRTRGFTYSNLSEAEQKTCDRFVKMGALTREQYVKEIEQMRKAGV
jgi:hypothetical protein